MPEPAQLAKAAREQLAAALNALQTADVPDELVDAAEPVAQAMGVLHRIERTKGENLDGRDDALIWVRTALDKVQKIESTHPAVEQVMEAIAASIAKVHALARYTPPAPPAPVAAPPVAAPPVAAPPVAAPPVAAAAPAAPAPVAAQPVPSPVATSPINQTLPQAVPSDAFQAAPPTYARPTPPVLAAQYAPPVVAADPPRPAPPPPAPPPPQTFSDPFKTVPAARAASPAAAPRAANPAASTLPSAVSQPVARPGASADRSSPTGGATVVVELGTHSASNFYKGLGGNDVIEHGGIFVATYKALRINTTVSLNVLLPGNYEFTASGVVQWTREGGSSDPGYGVRFTQITQDGRQLVYRYTRNREPMFYDDL